MSRRPTGVEIAMRIEAVCNDELDAMVEQLLVAAEAEQRARESMGIGVLPRRLQS